MYSRSQMAAIYKKLTQWTTLTKGGGASQHLDNKPHIHKETNSEMSEKLDFQPILAPG